MIAMSYYTC